MKYRANLCLCALPTSLLPATGSADELVNKTSCFCGVRLLCDRKWSLRWVGVPPRVSTPERETCHQSCGSPLWVFLLPAAVLPSVCVLILCVDHYGRR